MAKHPTHEDVGGRPAGPPPTPAPTRRKRPATPPLDPVEAFRRAAYDFAALHAPSIDSEHSDTLRDEIVAAVVGVVSARRAKNAPAAE